MSAFVIVLCVYLLTLLGVSFSHGFYTFGGVSILLAGFILFSWLNFFPEKFKKEVRVYDGRQILVTLLSLCVTLVIGITLLVYGGLYQLNIFKIPLLSRILLGTALFISLTYIIECVGRVPESIRRKRFIVMVGIMMLVQLMMVISSPQPKIDIFYSLKYGAQALSKLENPYQVTYPQVYQGKTLNYYSYFPSTLMYYSFFSSIFDPRLGIVAAHALAVYVLLKIFRKKKIPLPVAELMTLLFLYYPLLPFITEQSFTDSLAMLLCTVLLYGLVYSKKEKYMIVVIILMMNVKQIYFILMPLFFYKTKLLTSVKSVVSTYLLATLPVVPFLFLSWKDFLYDTVLVYLQPPQGVAYNASLNLRSFLANNFSLHINPNILFIMTLGYFALILFRFDGKKEATVNFKLLSQFFYGFFLLGGFAYLNHYFLVSQLILLYATCLLLNFYHTNPGESS